MYAWREVRGFGLLSSAKLAFAIYGLLGILLGLPLALLGAMQAEDTAYGLGAALAVPVIYALLGGISGLVSAFFYNLAAGLVGGLEIEIAE